VFSGQKNITKILAKQIMTTNILILCTHNSARSVLGEAMLNYWAAQFKTDVQGFSAGSSPKGHINPFALSTLQTVGIDTSQYRSKSWNEFALPSAPPIRMVITVCDSAASEVCPIWPGAPLKMHWGYPDPSNAQGGNQEKRIAFELTRQAIAYKMMRLAQIPFDTLSNSELQTHLKAIEQI
jgi:arsenate reductase (thioredoxin)